MTQNDVRDVMHTLLSEGGPVTFDAVRERLGKGSNRDLARHWKSLKAESVITTIAPALLAEIEKLCKSPVHVVLDELQSLVGIHAYLSSVLLPEVNRLAANLAELQFDTGKAEAKRDAADAQLAEAQENLRDVQRELSDIFSEVRTD